MDLETAVEQRYNNHLLIIEMNNRLAYAQNALNGEPVISTTVQQLNLRNQILKDLRDMNDVKTKAEGRLILINSRIDFIVNKLREN